MTRIEVFSDAAFAFAVTMLVISLSTIPENYEELLAATRRVPSFTASFAVMMLIWVTHRRWSQRFGLDDGVSTFLTLLLVLVVLIYVYPLKLIMDLMFYAFSQSLFPSDFLVSNTAQVAVLVAIFSAGFFLIALIQLGLHLRVASKTDELCLNQLEQVLINKEIFVWGGQAILAFLVVLMALIFRSSLGYLAGIVYSLTPLIFLLASLRTRSELRNNLCEDIEE
ncbi:TMEM175 family protein [Gilvimarinus sp. SDUM040013]|uniref:TMEM175 family protein n=1 Tax=Gilvimarinus gilvus TaxID=3058038 RepID=A0ABU4RSD6_9GAMM|nr:TMEM175 family protein [Gilvimarinus sp. SDUM040013]MDO3388247.1 TMEM175 family protein [Gilvimarinus sp. SDUM040013]MDX6847797.1 TMEM175 family protein [Gilvimarinus sp. SDUM040013]